MKDLTNREASILNGILAYLDPKYGGYITVIGLVPYCSESEPTIRMAIKRLVKKGWIRECIGEGIYTLTFMK
jgi:DNA-binding transcriptional regulator PaaX